MRDIAYTVPIAWCRRVHARGPGPWDGFVGVWSWEGLTRSGLGPRGGTYCVSRVAAAYRAAHGVSSRTLMLALTLTLALILMLTLAPSLARSVAVVALAAALAASAASAALWCVSRLASMSASGRNSARQ